MAPRPKPSTQDRKALQNLENQRLRLYRREQTPLAIYRDDARCLIHWYRFNQAVPYEEVHHVFGRGGGYGDWREHHSSLMCLCKACHQTVRAILFPYGTLEWVVAILRSANAKPLNEQVERVESLFEKEFYKQSVGGGFGILPAP